VVKQLVRSNCASLSPQYSSSPPMPCSSHTPPPQNFLPIGLPHWPACM
jgi:hypothetical protein